MQPKLAQSWPEGKQLNAPSQVTQTISVLTPICCRSIADAGLGGEAKEEVEVEEGMCRMGSAANGAGKGRRATQKHFEKFLAQYGTAILFSPEVLLAPPTKTLKYSEHNRPLFDSSERSLTSSPGNVVRKSQVVCA